MSDRPISYWISLARMGFEDDLHRIFDESGESRTWLANRLERSLPYVSRVLNGTEGNYQIDTMVKWARALGAIVQIRLIKEEGEVVRVVDYETARKLDEATLPEVAIPSMPDSQGASAVDFKLWKSAPVNSGSPVTGDADATIAPTGFARTGNG